MIKILRNRDLTIGAKAYIGSNEYTIILNNCKGDKKYLLKTLNGEEYSYFSKNEIIAEEILDTSTTKKTERGLRKFINESDYITVLDSKTKKWELIMKVISVTGDNFSVEYYYTRKSYHRNEYLSFYHKDTEILISHSTEEEIKILE